MFKNHKPSKTIHKPSKIHKITIFRCDHPPGFFKVFNPGMVPHFRTLTTCQGPWAGMILGCWCCFKLWNPELSMIFLKSCSSLTYILKCCMGSPRRADRHQLPRFWNSASSGASNATLQACHVHHLRNMIHGVWNVCRNDSFTFRHLNLTPLSWKRCLEPKLDSLQCSYDFPEASSNSGSVPCFPGSPRSPWNCTENILKPPNQAGARADPSGFPKQNSQWDWCKIAELQNQIGSYLWPKSVASSRLIEFDSILPQVGHNDRWTTRSEIWHCHTYSCGYSYTNTPAKPMGQAGNRDLPYYPFVDDIRIEIRQKWNIPCTVLDYQRV